MPLGFYPQNYTPQYVKKHCISKKPFVLKSDVPKPKESNDATIKRRKGVFIYFFIFSFFVVGGIYVTQPFKAEYSVPFERQGCTIQTISWNTRYSISSAQHFWGAGCDVLVCPVSGLRQQTYCQQVAGTTCWGSPAVYLTVCLWEHVPRCHFAPWTPAAWLQMEGLVSGLYCSTGRAGVFFLQAVLLTGIRKSLDVVSRHAFTTECHFLVQCYMTTIDPDCREYKEHKHS